MSLSLRGLLIACPIVALIVGGMAMLTYRSAIADYREDAASELLASNDAVADSLRRELALVSQTERKAARIMRDRLESGEFTTFEQTFAQSAQGAFHSRPSLWTGRELGGSVWLQGFGGFAPPPQPTGERRAAIMAAFDTIKAMANGLPDEIESLYFFSPSNDLLIFAPDREDELATYRNAPPGFNFQDAEFSTITSPRNNPQGELRCTSLQTPAYDDSGNNWTTGCMLPVRIEGRHIGAWGISIPLRDLTERLKPPIAGATTVIASADGKLVHHSGLTGENTRPLAANIDLAESEDPMLRALVGYMGAGVERQVEYSEELGAYVSGDRLDAPDWVVLTILPNDALSDRAWAIAKRVIGVAIVGTLLLGLVLAAIFHKAVATRITRLANRTDSIAAADELDLVEDRGDEIDHLEQAFDQMEERLAQARSRESRSFDVLVDAAKGYAMALYDREGALIRANEGAVALFGADEIAALGRKFGIGQSDCAPARTIKRPRREREVSKREVAGGRAALLEETLVPLADENGDMFGAAYIAHDLTSFRNAQRETEKTLLYLEMAQSSAQAGHFALDPQTMEVTFSPWLKNRLGLPDATMSLSDVPTLIDESRRASTVEAIEEAIAAKSDFSFETLAVGAGGNRFSALVRGTTVFDETGLDEEPALVGYFGILQDISEQKTAAEALVQALDEAKAETRARSDILAVLSHEIRTPLGGVLGIIDQLKREQSTAERERALGLMEDSCEALLDTLNAILQQARLSKDGNGRAAQAFRPSAVAHRVAELFRPLARRKGLRIEVHSPSGKEAMGDPGRIQQVLSNLVSNSVKFTQVGMVTIDVRQPVAPGDDWMFVVSDTGAGMDSNRVAKIFDPFDTSGTDSLGKSVGAGLGLSITRDIVEAMGGRIEIKSEVGIGSTFTISLPLGEPAAVKDTSRAVERGTVHVAIEKATEQIQAEAVASLAGWRVLDPGEEPAPVAARKGPFLVVCDTASLAELPDDMLDASSRIIVLGKTDREALGVKPHADKVHNVADGNIARVLPDLLENAVHERA
ncbi:MAG: ATP-binding protein [Erythrobacter sp.]